MAMKAFPETVAISDEDRPTRDPFLHARGRAAARVSYRAHEAGLKAAMLMIEARALQAAAQSIENTPTASIEALAREIEREADTRLGKLITKSF